MPNDFEALIGELRDAGLDDDYIDRLERATAASPIRKERDAFKAEAQSALERAQRAEAKALAASFKDMGIKVSPTALRLPEDLDVTSDEALKAWATTAGLVEPADTTPDPNEVAAHNQAGATANGAGTVHPIADLNDRIAKANSPEEVMALLHEGGIPTSQDG